MSDYGYIILGYDFAGVTRFVNEIKDITDAAVKLTNMSKPVLMRVPADDVDTVVELAEERELFAQKLNHSLLWDRLT